MYPKACNYYVTLRCNSRCVYCNIWRNSDNFKLHEQDVEEVTSNLKDLKRLGVKLVDFTGGEPLLYPHIVEVLKVAKNMGFITTITTNCLLYPKYASSLKGLVDVLQFSLDSDVEEEHDAQRGVKSYQKVMESIDIAKGLRQKIYLVTTVTNENYANIDRMVRFAEQKKVVMILNPCFTFFGNQGLSRDNAHSLKKYFGKPYVYMDLANIELIGRGGNDIMDPVCRAMDSFIVISPDNYLLLPCYHAAMKRIKIEKNLYEICNSTQFRELKKKQGKFDFCNGCTIECYMRGSLYKKVFSKYFILSLISDVKFLRESMRKQY